MVRVILLFTLLSAPSAITAANLRVLFIGNSLTYLNDLPKLTAQLAASARPPQTLETEFVGEGGASLKRHWELGKGLKAIRSGRWDYVVLQEKGGQEIEDPKMFEEYGRRFAAEIKKAGAKPLFFMSWANKDAPQELALLMKAHEGLAREAAAVVAPVGVAWQYALQENPKSVLHWTDGGHPDKAGSYLTACVFYAVLYSASPEGLSRSYMTEADAAFLQRIAWRAVQDYQQGKVLSVSAPAPAAKSAATEATPAALERGQAILTAAQKAAGGLERLRGLKDVLVTAAGIWATPQGDMAFQAREAFVFPALLRSEQSASGASFISFFDGATGWRKGVQGVIDLPENMKGMLRGQVIRNTINLLRAEGQFTVQFERQDSGADVILITKNGESLRLCVDPANGTLLRKTYRAGMGMGEIEEIYSDYREVSGIRFPFRVEVRQNGARFQELTVKEVKFNNGLDPAELARKPQ